MKEIRTQNTAQNTDNESRKVEGYAVVFNSLSADLGGFYEIIEDGAIDDDVINRSDILCLLDHNKERGVLARATNGKGSLKLTLDSHGLKYEFEAPHTTLGDEILEGLRRGDISKCSFAFTVEKDRWEKKEDGTIIRHIDKIKQLYDVSLVYNPAYEDTEVKADTRGLKELREKENNSNTDNQEMEDKAKVIEQLKALISQLSEDKKPNETEDTKPTEEKTGCEDKKEEKANEDNTEDKKDDKENTDGGDTSDNSDDTNSEDNQTEEQPTDNNTEDNTDDKTVNPNDVDDDPMDDTDKDKEERNKNKSSNINIRMSKKFSLIQTINDVVNNRQLNDVAKNLDAEARKAMAKSGIDTKGQINLPIVESRAGEDEPTTTVPNGIMATVEGAGAETVATEKLDLIAGLRNNSVIFNVGATMINGAVGNISIPRYTNSTAEWLEEGEEVGDGKGTFDQITLKPHRISCSIAISKQFLLQDSTSSENVLRKDICDAIQSALESAIFSADAATTKKPAGLFSGVTAETGVAKYDTILDMEEQLDLKNSGLNRVWVVNPKSKRILRGTKVDDGSGLFVYDRANEIDGMKSFVTNAVVEKGVLLFDPSDLVLVNWNNLSITVDPYTMAGKGMVKLIVDSYWDFAKRRDGSFSAKILK